MICPYCDSELNYEDCYGYLASHQSGEILGDIYRCPNNEGFQSEEEANNYLNKIGETLENLGLSSWEELTCESYKHHVSGSFYTDKKDNLFNGYPC